MDGIIKSFGERPYIRKSLHPLAEAIAYYQEILGNTRITDLVIRHRSKYPRLKFNLQLLDALMCVLQLLFHLLYSVSLLRDGSANRVHLLVNAGCMSFQSFQSTLCRALVLVRISWRGSGWHIVGWRMILALKDGLLPQSPGGRRDDWGVYIHQSLLWLRYYFHPCSLCRNEKESRDKEGKYRLSRRVWKVLRLSVPDERWLCRPEAIALVLVLWDEELVKTGCECCSNGFTAIYCCLTTTTFYSLLFY